MTAPCNLSDDYKNAMISPHIQGEVNMFIWCYAKLRDHLEKIKEIKCGYEKRAIHECFLLHARNLIEFLWNNPYSDDILASHYGVTLLKITDRSFVNVKIIINKQLSHITLSRLKNQDLLSKTKYIHKIITDGIIEYNNQVDNKYNLAIPSI